MEPFVRDLAAFLMLSIPLVLALDEHKSSVNGSSIMWTNALDVDDLQSRSANDGIHSTDEEIDGGFNSLDSMLQWAIEHSDPDTLKGAAHASQSLNDTELKARQSAIVELMESMRMPSDADLMKIAIADLQNSSSSFEDRQRALQELLELVEPIYHSNDLHKLGGLVVVVNELSRAEKELRILAAWVLGKASQNNELVQNQLLELNVLPTLMGMVRSSCTEEAVKALYALSAVIHNHPVGQEQFYLLDGTSLLKDLMKDTTSDTRLHRKCLFLVADLAEQQNEFSEVLSKYEPHKDYLMAVVNLLDAEDFDTKEKALMAIHSLTGSSDIAYHVLKHECHIKSVLHRLELQLDAVIQSTNDSDSVKDFLLLCQKIRSMFSNGEERRSNQ